MVEIRTRGIWGLWRSGNKKGKIGDQGWTRQDMDRYTEYTQFNGWEYWIRSSV